MTSRRRVQSARQVNRSASSRNMSFDNQQVDVIGRYSRKYSVPGSAKPNPYSMGCEHNSQNPYSPRNMVYGGNQGYGNYGAYTGSGYQSMKYSPSPISSPAPVQFGAHGRQLSNLIQPGNTTAWNSSNVINETEDMAQAMNNMIGDEASKINRKVNFLDELQMLAEADDLFCHLPNADDWSFKEVCYWMSTINLEKYIPAFEMQIIDGSILLRDLDEAMLTNELGVKRLHVKKMMREIKKLRDLSPKFSKSTENTRDALVESLRMEMNVIKRENSHLKLQVQRYKQQQSSSIFATISRRNSTIADRARMGNNPTIDDDDGSNTSGSNAARKGIRNGTRNDSRRNPNHVKYNNNMYRK